MKVVHCPDCCTRLENVHLVKGKNRPTGNRYFWKCPKCELYFTFSFGKMHQVSELGN